MKPVPNADSARAAHIVPIPAFSDNYIWLIRAGDCAVVVDPGDAAPVTAYLKSTGLRLLAILLTHHHNDHVGGALELSQATGATVYGPASERLPCCDVPLKEGDRVEIAEVGLAMQVLDVPGHTAGHIALAGQVAEHASVLFSGDTLFAGGCGRLFEGTPSQMLDSLDKFNNLPADTQVFCGHEYTLANLRWAMAVEPSNSALKKTFADAQALRARQEPTLPTSIGRERETNPFLRTRQATVAEAAAVWAEKPLAAPVEVIAALREWKNNFK